MRIPSGVTDQYVYFVAVDATDRVTRETGLSSFTVYRSRNGGASAAMTTPTINETDTTNMPGVYELLLDEDTTIDSGDDSQEMVFHITHAGMAPVTRTIELYRPKITAGNTLDVTATGAAGVDWGNVENPTTTVGLSGTTISTSQAVASVSGAVGSVTAGVTVTTNDDKTGYSLTQAFPTNFAALGINASGHVSRVTLVDTTTTNSDMRGTDSAATAAALATVGANVDAILADTGTDGVVVASGSKTGYALTSAYDFATGTSAMTESYAANGAAPTAVQALYAIHQMLQGFTIAGTSYTVKKLDGSTTAFVVTLDDGTSPTGATRA